MERIDIGDAQIIRILEWQGPFAPAARIVPGVADVAWRCVGADHYDPVDGSYLGAMQAWVVRTGGRAVLVDSGWVMAVSARGV
ncbi:hypothetical protein ACIQWA_39600 [Kitasatospora sp. NPDC098652]|uniref:hypothetical protein n=1 Tax=Kitasatospora sp. NPDC098652 TaxID=3364095 RepID=UPI00380AF205